MLRNLLASLVAFGVIFGTVGCEAPKKAEAPAPAAEEKKEEAAPAADAPAAEGEEKKAE